MRTKRFGHERTGVEYDGRTLWWRSHAARRFRRQRRRRHRKRGDCDGGGVRDLTGRLTVCTRRAGARTHRTRRSRRAAVRVRRRHASNARGQWSSWPAVDARRPRPRRRRPPDGSPALGPRPRQYPRCAPPPRWRRPPTPPTPSRRPSSTRPPPLPRCCPYCWRPRATHRRPDSSRASTTALTRIYVPGKIYFFCVNSSSVFHFFSFHGRPRENAHLFGYDVGTSHESSWRAPCFCKSIVACHFSEIQVSHWRFLGQTFQVC